MKKFSNINKKSITLKEQKTKINKRVELLIKENLNTIYNGDVNEALNHKLTIEGGDVFTIKLNELIKEYKTNTEHNYKNTLKHKNGSQYDQTLLNEKIESEKSKLNKTSTPSPEDIFSVDDYEQISENTFLLKTINNIPTDYMDYISEAQIMKYFETNNIHLKYNDNWALEFNNNGDYGTIMDSNDEEYKIFLEQNKEFIADFISATVELIGSDKILFQNKLIINMK